jgi:hypothetical protein
LQKALAEIVEKRPADPVEYLAHFLQKQVANKRAEQEVCDFYFFCLANLFLL